MAIPTSHRPDALDAPTVARIQARATEDAARAARTMVTFPHADHPLTRLYIESVSVSSYDQLGAALRLIKIMEQSTDWQTVAACQLAAEVLMERKLA